MIILIGTNVLAYAKPNVNNTVIKSSQNVNMSTLNFFEEQLLAKIIN